MEALLIGVVLVILIALHNRLLQEFLSKISDSRYLLLVRWSGSSRRSTDSRGAISIAALKIQGYWPSVSVGRDQVPVGLVQCWLVATACGWVLSSSVGVLQELLVV